MQHRRDALRALQVGIFQVIYLNRSAEQAFQPLQAFKPYVPFRDASCGISTFHLTVFDVIKVRWWGSRRGGALDFWRARTTVRAGRTHRDLRTRRSTCWSATT